MLTLIIVMFLAPGGIISTMICAGQAAKGTEFLILIVLKKVC
jgi:hypothetical protein